MNKIKIEIIDKRVVVSFDFENVEVAKQSLKDEVFIDDVIDAIVKDEERHYDDNDMLRASVQNGVGITSTKTLERMLELIQEELFRRK